MRGFPKHINTKEDITFLAKDYPAEMKEKLRNLIDARFVPVAISTVQTPRGKGKGKGKDIVDTNDPQALGDNDPSVTFELQEDAHSKLFALGLTVADAEAICEE